MLISWIFTYFIGKYFYDLAREFQRKAWPYTLLGVACFQGAQVLFGIIVFFVADQTGHHDIFRKDLRYLKLLAILAGLIVAIVSYTLVRQNFERKTIHTDVDVLDGEFID